VLEGAEGQNVGVRGGAIFQVEGEGVSVFAGEGGGGPEEA